jgi:hypothetical protein
MTPNLSAEGYLDWAESGFKSQPTPTKRIVGISGGKDSSCMALALKEREPDDYTFAITPTGRELPEMNAHWAKLEELLGQPLIRIPAPSLTDLIIKQKSLPNVWMRWCTRMVKIEPFMAYVRSQAPAITYIGIRADEVQGNAPREGTDWSGIEGVAQDLPFVRWGWGLEKVLSFLKERNIVVPPRTDCDICFFQRLIEWYDLWRLHIDLWMQGETLEDFTGHTFRSPQRDTWPASMKGLRAEFERGRIPKETRGKVRTTMCPWCAR